MRWGDTRFLWEADKQLGDWGIVKEELLLHIFKLSNAELALPLPRDSVPHCVGSDEKAIKNILLNIGCARSMTDNAKEPAKASTSKRC